MGPLRTAQKSLLGCPLSGQGSGRTLVFEFLSVLPQLSLWAFAAETSSG